MGLTERVFPRKINEDPFFRDEERDALRAVSEIDLENTSDRIDDERLLFYMAATAARERLILSFPRSSEESDTLPSFYLDEVRALFEHVPTEIRTLADVAPRPDECISDRDRLLSLCAVQDSNLSESAPSLLVSRHLPRLPELSASLMSKYGASRRYSITEVETYNRCPFQHFMKYGLEIRNLSDGAGAADKGTVLHDVMRNAFRKRREAQPGMESAFKNVDALKAVLSNEL
ncbi:MAG: PD-(D/E)XK nuclease family protein, partial [Armatimonadota bacterium]